MDVGVSLWGCGAGAMVPRFEGYSYSHSQVIPGGGSSSTHVGGLFNAAAGGSVVDEDDITSGRTADAPESSRSASKAAQPTEEEIHHLFNGPPAEESDVEGAAGAGDAAAEPLHAAATAAAAAAAAPAAAPALAGADSTAAAAAAALRATVSRTASSTASAPGATTSTTAAATAAAAALPNGHSAPNPSVLESPDRDRPTSKSYHDRDNEETKSIKSVSASIRSVRSHRTGGSRAGGSGLVSAKLPSIAPSIAGSQASVGVASSLFRSLGDTQDLNQFRQADQAESEDGTHACEPECSGTASSMSSVNGATSLLRGKGMHAEDALGDADEAQRMSTADQVTWHSGIENPYRPTPQVRYVI